MQALIGALEHPVMARWRWLFLFGLGAISALAHAPTFWVFLLPLTFGPALYIAIQRQTFWGLFWAVQCFVWGHFAAGMHWLMFPLFIGPAYQLLGLPVSLLGIPGVIAACFALPVALTLYLRRRVDGGAGRLSWTTLLLVALAWGCGDWLRSWVLTGLPWNVTAYVWAWSVPMMQTAAWWGPFGLSIVTAFASFATAKAMAVVPGAQRASVVQAIAVVVAVVVGLAALGLARLALVVPTGVNDVRAGLVQPAAKQDLRRSLPQVQAAVEDLLLLSQNLAAQEPDVVIWSEGATGQWLYTDPYINQIVLNQTTGETGTGQTLITGALRAVLRNPRALGFTKANKVTNSLTVVQRGGVVAEHEKALLVPFGEITPFRNLLALPNLSLPGTDFEAGHGVQSFAVGDLPPFSPLICYEAIFPGRVVDRNHRPSWMVNITTDAWFGDTSGPYQHLTSVRFRSVEEGLPTVRVAGAGISAVVDPFGRVVETIGLNERSALSADVPGFLPEPTFYASGGQIALAVLFWLFLAWIGVAVLSTLGRPFKNDS